jgi:uncharacterized membrane protein YcaP (DUF421 family)
LSFELEEGALHAAVTAHMDALRASGACTNNEEPVALTPRPKSPGADGRGVWDFGATARQHRAMDVIRTSPTTSSELLPMRISCELQAYPRNPHRRSSLEVRREMEGRDPMFGMNADPAGIILRSLVVYVGLLIGLRIMGKRELGQMTVFDLVVILLIANAVQNAMVGADTSLQGGLIAAAVLLLVNRAVSKLSYRWMFWGRLLEGIPTVLVQDGQFLESRLRKEGLEKSRIEMAMREHGIESIDAVKLAVLETDGTISIVPNDSKVLRTKRSVRNIHP